MNIPSLRLIQNILLFKADELISILLVNLLVFVMTPEVCLGGSDANSSI